MMKKMSGAASMQPKSGHRAPAGPTGPGPEKKAMVKKAQGEGASGGLKAAINHLREPAPSNPLKKKEMK